MSHTSVNGSNFNLEPVAQETATMWGSAVTFAKDCANATANKAHQYVAQVPECLAHAQALHPVFWVVLLWDLYITVRFSFTIMRELGGKYATAPAAILSPILGVLALHGVYNSPILMMLLALIGVGMHFRKELLMRLKKKQRKRSPKVDAPPRRSERLRQKREN